jgi:hypothetical protein
MIRVSHLTDEALLLLADRELSTRRVMRARRHLSSCLQCQARLAHIEQTLADAFEALGANADRSLPPAGVARARLALRMAEESERPGHRCALVPASMRSPRWLYGAAAIVVAIAIGFTVKGAGNPLVSVAASARGVFLLPRAELTPGATTPVPLREICAPDRPRRAQPIPQSIHEAVFAGYDADYHRAAEYELDYLITPELGSVADARNLWPQPFTRTAWNAYVKDELEQLFHRLVCEGKLHLRTAQREMASDWISSYKRHFKTDRPLRDYQAAPLTALDRDFIISELEEPGVSAPASARNDGPALLALLHAAGRQSRSPAPQARLAFAVFRPVQ